MGGSGGSLMQENGGRWNDRVGDGKREGGLIVCGALSG